MAATAEAISPERLRADLLEILSLLGCALAASLPSDDQIMLERIREAWTLTARLIDKTHAPPQPVVVALSTPDVYGDEREVKS